MLSIDEKTQIQALDRTQPLLPIDFDATEKRTHDYVRHGTTNLFAALNVGTGEVVRRVQAHPQRRGLPGLPQEGRGTPHAGKEIHVVLDNLSTHTTPEVMAWLARNPHVHFHFTPVGSSWINQIETWFGIITRQSIRRGTFTSVKVLIKQIRDYIDHWNTNAQPFSGPPPPTRSSPRSASSRPTSGNSSTTTRSKDEQNHETLVADVIRIRADGRRSGCGSRTLDDDLGGVGLEAPVNMTPFRTGERRRYQGLLRRDRPTPGRVCRRFVGATVLERGPAVAPQSCPAGECFTAVLGIAHAATVPASQDRVLLNPATVGTSRYRYRGAAIPTPWPATA